MISMRSQRKMRVFSSNFLGDKIFCKPKVSADFWADRLKSVEIESLQEKDRMAAHSYILIR